MGLGKKRFWAIGKWSKSLGNKTLSNAGNRRESDRWTAFKFVKLRV